MDFFSAVSSFSLDINLNIYFMFETTRGVFAIKLNPDGTVAWGL